MMRKALTSGATSFCRSLSTAPPAKRLDGKVCLVTAASEGIGLAAAKRLAHDGAKVMICSRRQTSLDQAMKEMKEEGLTDVMAMPCHVSEPDQREKLIEKTVEVFGGIDSLVHCAGISPCPGPVLTHNSTSFDKIIDVNVKSAFEFAKLVRPRLNARNGGTMVFLSSITAYQSTSVKLGMYAVAKLGLIGLAKEIAKEVVAENIRVNCVVAGTFKTKYLTVINESEEMREISMNYNLMKRDAEPHEIGGLMSFLVSDDSSYMTGESIALAGGLPSRI